MTAMGAADRGERIPAIQRGGYTLAGLAPERDAATDDGNWWMITLSDLTLLLLGFLVVWYVLQNRQSPATAPPLPIPQMSSAEANSTPPASRQWDTVGTEMQAMVDDLKLGHDIVIEPSEGQLLISLTDNVPFDSGKAELKPDARSFLERLSAFMVGRPELLAEISGHTDDRPIATALFPSNWELSAARASRVARLLIDSGVHPDRIAVQGYANQRPKAAGSDAVDRGANRRVEIRLFIERHVSDKQVDPEAR